MKKLILKTFAIAAFMAFATSCSNDTASIKEINNSDTKKQEVFETAARGTFWNDIIGYDRGNGVYEITADRQAIVNYFEGVLQKEGNTTTLTALNIVKKTATNDPNDTGYMLIGGDENGISIALWLNLDVSNHAFTLDKNFADKTISCRGCTSGCNIDYLTMEDGKKVSYCNENGCTYDCTKTETSTD